MADEGRGLRNRGSNGRLLIGAAGEGTRTALALVALLLALAAPLASEGPGFQDELLDRFTGEWVLEGTIAGGEVTHDLSAEWVLGHHYLRFHEVAREREADGSPAYEATVTIGWDPKSERYVCLWLDTTGGTGLNPDGFGYAKRDGDTLPFLWEGGDDGAVFHTTFAYDRDGDTWRWTMDSERDGEFRPFARLTMRRRPEAAAPNLERPASWAAPMAGHAGLENLHRVSDALYRGAQPEDEGFTELARLGIRTVVNLRTFHSDRSETREAGLGYVHIDAQAWEGEDEEVIEFLKVATDPEKQPLFVHCMHGADRTGVMAAAYRIVVEGWSKQDAIREMTEGGFGFHSVWRNLVDYVRDLDVERIRTAAGIAPPEPERP